MISFQPRITIKACGISFSSTVTRTGNFSNTMASSSQLLSLIALLVVLTLNIPAEVHALNPPAFLAPSLAVLTINVAYLVLFSKRARDIRTLTYGN